MTTENFQPPSQEVPAAGSVENTFEKRKQIIEELQEKLAAASSVFSFCLEGADAEGSVDEYSDIDMRVLIEEGSLDEALNLIESTVMKDGPIDFKTEISRPESKTHQVLYHLKDTSKFLILDIMVQECGDSANIKEGKKLVLFDKKNLLAEKEPDIAGQREQVLKRAEEIGAKSAFRSVYLERELERGNFLEAVNQYHSFVLKKLVEALRLLYCPQKSDFYLKHLSKDLPPEIVGQIEDLYRVNTIEEIKGKKIKADELLRRTLAELKASRGGDQTERPGEEK